MTNSIGAASIELSVDATGVESGMNRTEAAIGRGTRSLQNLGAQGNSAFTEIGNGSGQAATRVDAATRSLINAVQRTTAAMESGSRGSREYFESLATRRGVNLDSLRPYLEQLQAVQQAQRNTGASAAQTAAALRQVPAQVTDIITSLQGGQQPLTVFLQQGGQLRDMFGSSGAAARALGGYVAGLVNPYTIAAAAAAALAVAYYQGSKEADGYAHALIMTGNAAAATTGQLADVARETGNVVGTQHEAAAAVAALAGTGQVKYQNLRAVTLATVEAQRYLGKAVKETADEFADLGRAPLQTADKLNEKYNFLTSAVYAQIKALEDQGKTSQAAEVAQKAYASALDERARAAHGNMGTLEKGWESVEDAAKRAWDSMLNVGRKDTLAEQLAAVDQQIKTTKTKLYSYIDGPNAKARLVVLQAEKAALLETQKAQDRANEAKAESNRQEKARIDWIKEGEKYQSRQEQLEQDITKARNLGVTAGKSQAEVEQRIGEIRKRYADIYDDSIDSQIEAIKRRGAVEDEVAKRSQLLLEGSRSSGLVNQEDYLRAAAQLDQAAFQKQKERLMEELALTGRKQNSLKDQASLRGQIAVVAEQQTTRQIQLESELYQEEVKRARLAAENFANVIDGQIGARDSLRQQLTAQRDANDQLGLSARALGEVSAARLEEQAATADSNAELAESIDLTGQMSGVYRQQAQLLRDLADAKRSGAVKQQTVEAAKEAEQAWKRTAEQIESSLTDALMRGFEGGKGFARNLRDATINMFKTLVLRPTIQGIVTGSVGGGTTAGGAVGSALQQASGLGGLYSAFAGLGGTVTGVGNLVGSSYLSALGMGLSQGAGVGEAIAAYTAAGQAGVAGASTVASGLSLGSSISTTIAAIPGWGWAAMGAAALIGMSGLFGDGPEKDTHLTFASNNAAGNISINERGNEGKWNQSYIDGYGTGAFGTFGVSNSFWMSSSQDAVQGFIRTVTQVDDALAGFLTKDEQATVTSAVSNQKITARTGEEGANPNAKGQLDKVFADRLNVIFDGISPGLSTLLSGFKGTSQELASEAAAILQFRQALGTAGEAVFGAKVSLEELAKLKGPSETTSAALARVTAEFKSTNVVLDVLGVSTAKAFGGVGLASEAARQRLIEMAGGASALAAQSQYFTENYLSEAERLAPVQKQVAAQLAELGLSHITTADQYKQVVLGLASSGALATESGAKTYAALMALAPAFMTVADAAASTTDGVKKASQSLAAIAAKRSDLEAQIFDMTHSEDEVVARKRRAELAALDESLRPLQERIYALADEQAATEAATTAAQEAAAAIAKAQEDSRAFMQNLGNSLVDTMQRATDAAKALRAYNSELAIGSDSPLSGKEKVSIARQQFESADGSTIQQASAAYLNVLKENGASGLDYAKAFAAVQAKVSAAAAQYDAYAASIPAFWQAIQNMMSPSGSHATGLDSVPYDGYRAVLHRDEKVLTSSEAGDYRGIGKALAMQNTLLQRISDVLSLGNKDLSLMSTLLRGVAPDGRSVRTTAG